ncbi:MAG TPA: sensor domain-containing diguanylate cyclase [Methylophilaceae bacterium]|nr:sensor domain-containing diguanylate cyclase [Methylophilaceae bacterium]
MKNPILSDKHKLITVLSILLSIGFIITSLASYFVSKNTIRQSILQSELPLTSDNIYSEIQKDLVRPTFVSSMMASDTFLRDWVLDGEKNVGQMSKYLQEVKTRYGAFASFFISERSQHYYYESGILKKVQATDAHDVWYYRVRAMNAPYEISVDTDQAHQNTLTIFINYRVFDYHNRFLGVAGIGLTVDEVRKYIDSYQKRYQRSIYFVDADGNIVLFGNGGAHNSGASISKIPGLQAHAADIFKHKTGSYQYQRDGKMQLLNVRYIPELSWYLFVEKSEDEALSEIRNTLYLNLAVCLLITGVVIVLTNLTINRYQRRLEEMATTDKLTGLANRQTCELVADHAMKEAKRDREPLSAIIIDIDYFKDINDRYGHLAGDAVLKGLADTTKACLRESDFICRWGGEEYLLLLKNCDTPSARHIAENIRATIKKTSYGPAGTDINVTVSIGIAEYVKNETLESLLNRADQALYAAKQSGRDRISSA